jgi:hypothetical protein
MLLLILSLPAFKYFFYGEAFIYLRIYDLNGRHLWRAAFSSQGNMFFRPGLLLSTVWWFFVLPPDPMAYHVRNFIFCCLNLFLLHRVLLKFVKSRPARAIALCLFAASKIHMTIIGYIGAHEVSILLMTILLAVLFWFRYIETRGSLDYVLALVFCALSVYSKDQGLVVIGILAAMIVALDIKQGDLMGQVRYWAIRFAPFVIISVSNLVLRFILIGPINRNHAAYSPRLSWSIAGWQTEGFLATAGNFSLTQLSTMGNTGFSGLLAENSTTVEAALCAGLWLLILFTLWRGRSSGRLLVVPVVWIGLYLSPIFLIRNHQLWYYQEPLVGLALLIGICLERAKRPLLTTWWIVVALIAINGFISNQRSHYGWQYAATQAETIIKPILLSQKPNPAKSIVFVTTPGRRDYWDLVIGGPMIPQLLAAPDMTVDVVASDGQIRPGAQVYHLPD